METRQGRQTPTTSVVIPYTETLGDEAIEIYNRTEKSAMEWQKLLMADMMSLNEDGLWNHTKYGFSVPRRNGKSEVAIMRVVWGLFHGEKILWTAHRTTTSHSSWERVIDILEKGGRHVKEDYRTTAQFGLEHIEMLNEEGGVLNFRTRSSKGGLGEGYDLLIIDEAQEYTEDQESALKYVVTSSLNPQTVMLGTPPTTVSVGTVFTKFRRNCLTGNARNGGWAEWSVDFTSDCNDAELWYHTNPSLGTVFTERSVADEVGTDDVDFNIQRLGLWLQYNQKSAISKTEWSDLKVDTLPELLAEKHIGIKYSPDGSNVSVGIACKTVDDQVFVEAIDCQSVRNGDDWILGFLRKIKPTNIVIDGAGRQKMLADGLKDVGIRRVVLPTVKEVISANTMFEQAMFEKWYAIPGNLHLNKLQQIVKNVPLVQLAVLGTKHFAKELR